MQQRNRCFCLIFPLALIFAAPLAAERITFRANSMTGRTASKSSTVILEGDSLVRTSSLEIAADKITLGGDDFRYIEAEGTVKGKNLNSKLHFACDIVRHDRKVQSSSLMGNVSLQDDELGIDASAELIDYDWEGDVATMQAGILIKQKENTCTGSLAVYRKKEKTLELSGGAEVKRGNETFHAQTVILDIATQEIMLSGKMEGAVLTTEENGE